MTGGCQASKELYSLICFNGEDIDPNASSAKSTPFINRDYFVFAYGDPKKGERLIDAQVASGSAPARPTVGVQTRRVSGISEVTFTLSRTMGWPHLLTSRGWDDPSFGANSYAGFGGSPYDLKTRFCKRTPHQCERMTPRWIKIKIKIRVTL